MLIAVVMTYQFGKEKMNFQKDGLSVIQHNFTPKKIDFKKTVNKIDKTVYLGMLTFVFFTVPVSLGCLAETCEQIY